MQDGREIPSHPAKRTPQPEDRLQLTLVPRMNDRFRPSRQHGRGSHDSGQGPKMRDELPIHPECGWRHKHIYRISPKVMREKIEGRFAASALLRSPANL